MNSFFSIKNFLERLKYRIYSLLGRCSICKKKGKDLEFFYTCRLDECIPVCSSPCFKEVLDREYPEKERF